MEDDLQSELLRMTRNGSLLNEPGFLATLNSTSGAASLNEATRLAAYVFRVTSLTVYQ